MKDNILMIGLDFETSTGDTKNLSPIQIGLVVGDEDFESNIALPDEHVWSMNSQEVHGITMEELEDAPTLFEVDVYASAWLLPLVKGVSRMNRIAVGWNVGSFDRRIVNDHMPILDQILSYRTLDLNTVCYFTADLLNESYANIKRKVKEYAAEQIGGEAWHDALFDAKAGMLTYERMLEMADLDVDKLLRQSVKT